MVSGSFARKRRTQRKQRKLRKQRTARKQRRQLKRQSGGCRCDKENPYAVPYIDCPVCSKKEIIYFYEAYDHHGFLSNFYTRMTDPAYQQAKDEDEFNRTFDESKLIPVVYEGISFVNSEHAFCYAKAKNLGYGKPVLDVIIATKNPYTIKEIGSGQKRILDGISIGETANWSKWGAANGPIMYDILFSKFHGDPYMARLLKDTGDAMLVEAAPGDFNWGIGFSEDAAPDNKKSWGKNRLGLTLMEVRDALA